MNKEEIQKIFNEYKDRIIIHKNITYSGNLKQNILLFKEINTKYPNIFKNITEIIYLMNHSIDEKFCYCGNKNSFRGLKYGYAKYCSNKCAANSKEFKQHYEDTLYKRYGVRKLSHTSFMQEKFKDPEWGKKCRQNQLKTFQKRTGYLHPSLCPESNEKRKKTMQERYNVDHHWMSKDPKLNGSKTRLEKYGYYNSFNMPEVKQKAIIARKNPQWIEKVLITRNKNKKIIFEKKHKHFEDYNEKFFRDNFIKDGKFDIKACCDYFNIIESWCNCKKREFNIIEPNKNEQNFKLQKEVFDYIKSIYNGEILFNTHKIIYPLEIDIYIPEKKIGIEFNGAYWHSIRYKDKDYHYKKSLLAKEKDIELIHIWEDQWLYQKDLIKSIIKVRLGLNTNKIFARKCIIKEITTQQYKDFTNKNHIQGYRKASIKLGLFYNDELVQIASFSKSNKYDYEWIRGCPASLNIVVGGTSKLFNYFIKNFKPKSVLCYADFNLFNGQGYRQCGFQFNGYTGPNKFYFDSELKRIERNPHRYKEYKQLVENNQLLLCYGCGSLRYIWFNKI